jgi:hypothetical protein
VFLVIEPRIRVITDPMDEGSSLESPLAEI